MKCSEKEKNCDLISFVEDKGREIFLTFQWETVDRGSEHRQSVSEKDILEHVAGKFKTSGSEREPHYGGGSI